MKAALHRLASGFGEPLLLAALTIGGLAGALAGVGVFKAIGVLASAAPLAAILRHALRARPPGPSTRKRP